MTPIIKTYRILLRLLQGKNIRSIYHKDLKKEEKMSEIIKEIYYYFRETKNRRPVITICLLQTKKGNIGKGIALCSKKDMPNKSIGRTIAKRRALRALKKKESSLPIRRNRIYPAEILIDEIKKSYYNSVLTGWESKLLKR